jgi:uncharacterized membrane protein HdeD (DUF308 family)
MKEIIKMTSIFGRTWWGLVLRGLLSILFGIAVFVWPGASLMALIALFGAFFFVDGLLALVNAFRVRAGHERWWALLLEGLVGIAIGLITLFMPDVTTVALLYLIAAWAIVTGILQIIGAIRFADVIDNEWLLALGGLASIVFGVLMAIWPAAGATAVLWVIAAYAIVFGILMVIAGLHARSTTDTTTAPRPA